MKIIAWPVVFSVTALLLGSTLEAQAPSVLEPKVERLQGPPLWNSADSVADRDTIIKLDLISSDALRKRVEKQRRDLGDSFPAEKVHPGEKPEVAKIPQSECKSESYLEDYRVGDPSTSLRDLSSHSKSIIRGKIRSVEFGFGFGTPTSLLGVEVSQVIKGRAPKSPLYVDYPVARFRIGPLYFCNATKGFEPSPGDEILLFDVAGPIDRLDLLYAPRMDQIFFQDQGGKLFVPPSLKNTEDLKTSASLADVIGRLRISGMLNPLGGAR
ncbi:MAG TPA: hypothetical protein VLV54_12200 [Thermoanaerobaculia bacterium]|nr:hypothetical protein [Thermoanaerobaculia bacterium]